MKNKIKLFLVILLIVIGLLIPIIVFGNEGIRVAVEKMITSEEYNKKREQEKMNWLNSEKTLNTDDSKVLDNSNNELLINQYNKTNDSVNEVGNKFDIIMTRFYKDDYEKLCKMVEENSDKMSLKELYRQPYTEKIFNMVIDILKNEDITEGETLILKNFLQTQYSILDNNSIMKSKIAEIIK